MTNFDDSLTLIFLSIVQLCRTITIETGEIFSLRKFLGHEFLASKTYKYVCNPSPPLLKEDHNKNHLKQDWKLGKNQVSIQDKIQHPTRKLVLKICLGKL